MDQGGSSRALTINSLINELADRQQGLVTRWQLIEGGVSSGCIQRRIDSMSLHQVARGVYGIGRGPMTQEAVWMAAVLGAREYAVLSGRSAAVLHGFLDRERVIDVRCSHTHVRGNFRIHPPVGLAPFVHVRRCRSIDPSRVEEIDGIPVVRAAVALLQLAEELNAKQLKNAFIRADRLDLLRQDDLAWLIEPKFGFKGGGVLRRLVSRRNPEIKKTRSVLEALFLELCEDAGLPAPEVDGALAGYRTDFRWPEAGLIVELDGARYHRGVAKLNADQDRENDLVAIGNAVLRFDWGQVEAEGPRVVALVAAALRRRGADLNSSRY